MTRSSRSAMSSTAGEWSRSWTEELSSASPEATRDPSCYRASPPRRRQGDDDALCRHDCLCPLCCPDAGAVPVAGRSADRVPSGPLAGLSLGNLEHDVLEDPALSLDPRGELEQLAERRGHVDAMGRLAIAHRRLLLERGDRQDFRLAAPGDRRGAAAHPP